jgi:signal transduction histidine kinase
MQNCLHLISGKVKPQGAPAYELLRTEAARLGRLVREILGLYRSPQPAPASDLNAAVSETLRALQPRLRRAQVAVTRSRGPRVRVAASSVELQLLVSNLVANAADAMPGGGKLRIETRVLPRRRVRLRVADTGTGIPAALASRIFQPFVSSKGERGTGLGLWIVAQIAAHHGGRVCALPRKGGGTVMEVELPAGKANEKAKVKRKR